MTAVMLNGLADVVRMHGRLEEACRLHERALAIRRQRLDPDNHQIGESLNNLAECLRESGVYQRAEGLYREVLGIWERHAAAGGDPLYPAVAMNNLAECLRLQQRPAEAFPYYERVLAIAEPILGPEHPNVATTLSNQAMCYADMDDYASAQPLMERAFHIFAASFGPAHPRAAQILFRWATIAHAAHRPEALALARRAAEALQLAFGADHPSAQSGLRLLAEVEGAAE